MAILPQFMNKVVEGFYTNFKSTVVTIGKEKTIAYTDSLFYISQEDGKWMIEHYSEPGDSIELSGQDLEARLNSLKLLPKDELFSRIKELRKNLEYKKEQAEIDLESLRQQEQFIESKK